MNKAVIDLANILQRFCTKTLWHFTGYNKSELNSYKILLSIINGQTLKISERQPIIKMSSKKDRWGYKCSCMCDIPFKDLRIHTIRYGTCGISFHKVAAIQKGHFNPVLYIHNKHFLFEHAEKVIESLENLSSPHEELDNAIGEFLTLLGTYTKSGNLLKRLSLESITDDDQENNFYYEREWRSAYEWKFTEKDVTAIMLPEKYIEDFRKSINSKFSNVSLIATEMISLL